MILEQTLKYLEERYLNVGERVRHENITEPLGSKEGLIGPSTDFHSYPRDSLGLRHRQTSSGMSTALSTHDHQHSDYSTNGRLPITVKVSPQEENGLTNSLTQDVETTTSGSSVSRRTWLAEHFNRYTLYRLFGGIC